MIYYRCLCCTHKFDDSIRYRGKWCCPLCLSPEIEEIDTLYEEQDEHEYDPSYKPWEM